MTNNLLILLIFFVHTPLPVLRSPVKMVSFMKRSYFRHGVSKKGWSNVFPYESEVKLPRFVVCDIRLTIVNSVASIHISEFSTQASLFISRLSCAISVHT